jgi:hypothetical protein
MLNNTSPLPQSIDNKEQLLLGLVASTKMLLVALSLVVLFVVLFAKSIISFAMVAMAALNMLCEYCIRLIASVQEVKEFSSFLATGTRPI